MLTAAGLKAEIVSFIASDEKLPVRLAVPFILAVSSGLWTGLWKLGALCVNL